MNSKGLLIACLAIFLFSCSHVEHRGIRKVEHFYIHSNNAKEVFQMFRDQFGLPAVWDYQNWGEFSSGGITMGNIVLEIKASPGPQAQFDYGIALESDQSLERASSLLDSVKISRSPIHPYSGWSILPLNQVLPNHIDLFVCDYHDKKRLKSDREGAAGKLLAKNGGPLGIRYLQEITIAARTTDEFEKRLEKIPGILKEGEAFHFSSGPSLRLIESDSSYLGLLIKVNSAEKARSELNRLGLRTKSTTEGLVLIDSILPAKISLLE